METNDSQSPTEKAGGTSRPASTARPRVTGGLPLNPIPIPPAARWREIRMRGVPVLVFALSVLGASWLWLERGTQGAFVAQAEGKRAFVSSPVVGVIEHLAVVPYQMVTQGETIGVVSPLDPRARLDLLRMRLQVASGMLEPTLAQRSAVDYQRLRVEVLSLQVELAKDRVGLNLAETELTRSEELFRQKLVSQEAHDLVRNNRDLLRVEVQEKEKAVADLRASLETLQSIVGPDANVGDEQGRAALAALEREINRPGTDGDSITLTAPISGMVSFVYRGAGENVRDGEPVVAIQSGQAERLVGYVRQPFSFEPEPGMKVQIKTRRRNPQLAETQIAQVGMQLETITNALTMIRPGLLQDVGLAVVLTLPTGLEARPGEMFDVIVPPSSVTARP